MVHTTCLYSAAVMLVMVVRARWTDMIVQQNAVQSSRWAGATIQQSYGSLRWVEWLVGRAVEEE